MNTVVVYPGRFMPLHKGHLASYEYLAKKFGANNVYIATSNVQSPDTNPFSYSDKVMMATKLGIPAGHIVQVKNPYVAQEIVNDVADPESTVLVFALSAKDMTADAPRFKFGIKKNGEPSYMQPYPADGKKLQPMTKHAYVFITPTVDFKVRGKSANSASEVRKMYADGNDNDRMGIITDLYGEPDQHLKDVFDKRLLATKETYAYARALKDNPNRAIDRISEARVVGKLVRLMETMLKLEAQANAVYEPLVEDLAPNPDYLDE